MTDTETPIEAGARALRALTWAPNQERMSTQMAGAVFGSVDVGGLAAVIDPTIVEPLRSKVMAAWDSADLDSAQYMAEAETKARKRAEAVIAWLGGGE